MIRRKSREIQVGNIGVGGQNPVRVQSMTNTDTCDVEATLAQVGELAQAGCEIVRVAVPNEKAAACLKSIRQGTDVPLIADIHFDSRLAVAAVEAGVDGLRINPGNIGGSRQIDRVVDAAKAYAVPIRVGVNSGSVEKSLLQKYGGPTPEAMVESALTHVRLLEERNFFQTKVSLKSSDVLSTVAAYRLLAEKTDYPLHIGITEAGTPLRGATRSGVGLGLLLFEGIGDTLRISLTSDPVQEMLVAWELLRSLGLRSRGPEIISCPTCGRTEVNLIEMAQAVEKRLLYVREHFTVAVMGCVVNGPGEAREADIGIAGGRESGIVFRKGRIVRKIHGRDNLVPQFLEELDIFLLERKKQECSEKDKC